MRKSTVVNLALVNSLLILAGSGCAPAARDKEKDRTSGGRVGGIFFIPGGGGGANANQGARPGGGNIGRTGFGGSGRAIS
jgi:hypothetical protein